MLLSIVIAYAACFLLFLGLALRAPTIEDRRRRRLRMRHKGQPHHPHRLGQHA